MITEAIIVLTSILAGFFLRDLRTEAIQKKTQEIKRKVFAKKSKVMEWSPPETYNQKLEKEARKDL